MCGIVGFLNRDPKIGNKTRTLFEQMLWSDTLRGADGTGVVLINGVRNEVLTYKNALYAPDFLHSHGYRNLIYKPLDYAKVAIGHNRAATKGTATNANAHPFQHGSITLVHNGYIQNHHMLVPTNVPHDVDSFAAAYVLHEKGEKEGLESLRGAFALVWWNAADNTLNMARNEGRELWCVDIKDHDTLVWASEWKMIHWLLGRNGLEPGSKYRLLTPYNHFKFALDKPVTEYQKSPFAEPRTQSNTGGVGRGSNNVTTTSRNPDGSTTIPTSSTNLQVSPFRTITTHQVSDSELDRIEAKFSKISAKDKKRVGIPTSRKKLRSTYCKLHNAGFHLGQEFIVYFDSWEKYPNQRELGRILGSKRANADVRVEVPNMTKADYEALQKLQYTFATVVNIKTNDKGKKVLVCYVEKEGNNWAAPPKKPEPTVTFNRGQEKVTLVRGPRGSYIELSKFQAMVSAGCGHCTGVVNPNFSHMMEWIGDDPICHVCANDPKTRELLFLDKIAPAAAKVN